MFKRIAVVLLTILMICCFCTMVFASTLTPRYMYTSSIRSSLTISGNTATCTSEVKGYLGETTKIVIEQVLEKEVSPDNWDEVDSWTNMKNLPSVNVGDSVNSLTELGLVGNTGNSTGAHLHFDVNNVGALAGGDGPGFVNYSTTLNPLLFFPDIQFTY